MNYMINTTRLPNLILAAFAVLSLQSCMPEDSLVAPVDRGEAQLTSVQMGSDYHNRIYFDLGATAVVKSINFEKWDLEFACQAGEYTIRLNSAKFASVADLGVGTIAAMSVTDLSAAEFHYDVQSGGIDSTAMSFWWTNNSESGLNSRQHIYLLDRGYSAAGKQYGRVFLKITDVNRDAYTIEIADLDGSNSFKHTIERDARFNYIGFNIDNKTSVEFEPPLTDWDLVFTKYAFIFQAPEPLPYSVNGVLTNPYLVRAAEVKDVAFEEIDRDLALALAMSSRPDIIGYDWKTFILEESLFVVDTERSFVVKDIEGFLHKLRFTDFYDADTGDKGSPTFEVQRL